MRDYVAIANEYIRKVIGGEKPACQLVKQACQRQLDDLSRQDTDDFPFVFNRPDPCRRCGDIPAPSCRWCDGTGFEIGPANKICRFVEYLPHIEGTWASDKLILEPWQCFLLTTVFGWTHRETGLRRFRKALVVVPVRNGKSILCSAIALFLLTADGELGPQIASAALTVDQAKVVWNISRAMVEKSPELRERCGIEISKDKSIFIQRDNASFKPLSRDAKTLEGKNLHGIIIDELAQHKTREVFDTLSKRTGSRKQPLMFMISTEGDNAVGVFADQVDYLTKILGVQHRDDAYFGIVYSIDKDADWSLEESWRIANPNYGISVTEQSIRDAYIEAQQNPAAQSSFKTRILNIRVGAGEAYINLMKWTGDCRVLKGSPWAHLKSVSLDDFEGESCIVGLDLATKNDIAAKAMLFQDGRYFALFGKFYCPESRLEKSSGNPNFDVYRGWHDLEYLTTTPGNVIDFEQIEADLIEDVSRFHVKEVAFDPWQATELSTRMKREGVEMVEVPMQVRYLSEPMKSLQSLVDEGRIKHDGNPVMTWMFGNLEGKLDFKENVFPRKARMANKIDGAVATIMALSRAIVDVSRRSVYEDEEVKFVG